MANTNYLTQPVIGARLFTTQTFNTAGGGNPGPEYTLGATAMGKDGSLWMYVQAASAIAQYDAVSITATTYQAASLTKAAADALNRIGFAQVAFASGDYGWVCIQGSPGSGTGGNIQVNTLTGTTANGQLYTTATAGALSTTSSSQTLVRGCSVSTANASGGTTGRPLVASLPASAT